jgi:predicted GNAT family acetyltransferase
LAEAFDGFRIIGPAFIGYAEHISPAPSGARLLVKEDFPLVDELRRSCEELAWEHGGSEVEGSPTAGAFENGRLVSLAGYEVWDDAIAHISVVTHPDFRGHGHGRAVVTQVAAAALEAGLLPQYRTLEANAGSIRIAEALGFERYATSVAVRLNGR